MRVAAILGGAPAGLFAVLVAGLVAGLTAVPAARAQGAILDFLDGETLYDGGSLLTFGQQLERRDTLLEGERRIADPRAGHERFLRTTLAFQHGVRHDLQLGVALGWVDSELVGRGVDGSAAGFGDVELLAKWRFLRLDAPHVATNFALLGALSLPAGEDDERSGGRELEPELQPGSGSLDPSFGIAVTHEPGRWRFNAAALYAVHTDLDDDGDRRGDELTAELAVGNRFWLEPYPGPFMRCDVIATWRDENRDRVDGRPVDGGGRELSAAINLAFRPRPSLDFQVRAEVPVWQRVDGSDLATDWTLDVTVGVRF